MKIIDFLFKKPRIWFIFLIYFLTVLACASAITLLCLGIDGVPTYITYGVAACLLGYSVYTLIRFAPKIKRGIKAAIYRFSFTKKFTSEYDFRTLITSTASLALNISYAVFNIVIAIISRSLWYGAIGVYHLLLVGMRSDVLLSRKKESLASYIRCASLLTLLSFFLSLAVWQMVANDLAFVRFGWTIYAYAAFAFYKITMATISFFKSRKKCPDNTRAPLCGSCRRVGFNFNASNLFALYLWRRRSEQDAIQRDNGCRGMRLNAWARHFNDCNGGP